MPRQIPAVLAESALRVRSEDQIVAANASGELYVVSFERDAFGMNGKVLRFFEQLDEISLGGFLKRDHCCVLVAKIVWQVFLFHNILRDFSHEPAEGTLSNEKIRALLVLSNVHQGARARTVAVRFLWTASRHGVLSRSLCGEAFPWGLAASRLAGCLFCASHGVVVYA